jgi:hypothetical protein
VILSHSGAWEYLRSRMLRNIPPQTVSFYRSGLNTAEWRRNGSYVVTSMDSGSVEIDADHSELSQALLGDSEHLLDHAHEHIVLIQNAIDGIWTSPAWFLVTSYYMTFYSVMAVLRLLGDCPMWFDFRALTHFEVLSGLVVKGKSAGTYDFLVEPSGNATRATVRCKQKRLKPHEAAWNKFNLILIEANRKSEHTSNDRESRYLGVLLRSFAVLGFDWPSQLRNEVNYHPGLGYREVLRDGSIDVVRFYKRLDLKDESNFLSLLESTWAEVEAHPSLRSRSKLLSLCAILCVSIAIDLHSELIANGLDPRWNNLRSTFLRDHNIPGNLLSRAT